MACKMGEKDFGDQKDWTLCDQEAQYTSDVFGVSGDPSGWEKVLGLVTSRVRR